MTDLPDPQSIPQWAKEYDNWCMWSRQSDRTGKPLKKNRRGASWSDADCGYPFQEAYDTAESDDYFDGIGVVIPENADHYGIDLDGCLREPNEEKPKEWVPELDYFVESAYIEYSKSGTGLHIFARGDLPEWWKNSHFSDDEHEGVEAYSNKFFIFTGKELSISADDPQEVDPKPWLLQAFKAVRGRLPDPFNKDDTSDYDGDSELSKDIIEDALESLNPDMGHSEWVRVGFAVHDWDSGRTGQSVFESWSRGGSKWDSDAQNTIDWIWSNADQGGDVTTGTLIYKAKQNGWSFPGKATSTDGGTAAATPNKTPEPPTEPDQNAEPETESQDTETSTESGIEYKLTASELITLLGYDPEDTSIKDIPTHELANGIEHILRNRDDVHLTLLDTSDSKDQPIYAMDKETKVWENKGERRLAQLSRQILGFQNRKKIQSELANSLRSNPSGYWLKNRDELGIEVGQLAVANGVLDLDSIGDGAKMRDAKPDDYLLGRLPVEYDPDASIEGTRFQEFLKQSVKPGDRDKLQEYAGYTLYKNAQPYKKALFLVGPTDSGKGTFIETLESILGEDNHASETMYDLANSRWGPDKIYGKMVNTSNEVSPQGISNVGQFKMLTGGEDTVSAEAKGEQKYKFTVTQKFLFATNEFPQVDNADEAFYNRLLFAEFPNSFKDDKDPDLIDDLHEERQAILNWMLEGLHRLRENDGQFTDERPISEKKELTKAFGSPIEQFAHDALEITGDPEHVVHKKELYAAFTRFCDWAEADTPTQQKFTQDLKGESGISDGESTRVSEQDKTKGVFKGIKLNTNFLKGIQADEPSHSYSDDRGGQQHIS